MVVRFRTNVDHYKTNCWPQNIENPPRKGDTVVVAKVFEVYYKEKNLPTRMEVVDVIWTEYGVVCELWYKAQDVEFAKLNGTNLF
jgi:hypothetical protein